MSPKTLLLVEDSAPMRQLITSALARAALQIIEAVDGQDALDRLETLGEIHLALVDLHLPKRDGLEVIRALRRSERTRAVPIVVVSSEERWERREEARRAGATGWIVKPFRPEAVLRVVHMLLGRSAVERA